MDSKPSIESSEKETPKRLAFSVENILDPTKFTGKQKHFGQGANGQRMWNNIERDDKMDDDQSDDRSSEYLLFGSVFYLYTLMRTVMTGSSLGN